MVTDEQLHLLIALSVKGFYRGSSTISKTFNQNVMLILTTVRYPSVCFMFRGIADRYSQLVSLVRVND